jgi:hypothetical protein
MLPVFSSNQLQKFNTKLRANGSKGIQHVLKESIAIGLGLAASVGIGGIIFQYPPSIIILAVFGSIVFPTIIRSLYHLYLFEHRTQQKEALIPDALLQAALFPENTDIVSIMRYLSRAEYGLLSEEFAQTCSEIEKGTPVHTALENMKERNNSKIIDRACSLLLHGYESGTAMHALFQEAADDLLETNALIRERGAALTIEKYTLLFAGGLIVPSILGLIVGMVNGFAFIGGSDLDFGLPIETRKELLAAALLGNQVYIVEYALIAAFFLAHQEGDRKKVLVYAGFLLPASLMAYTLARGGF